MTPTSVLIVDDHPVVRAGIRQVLNSDPRFHVVGEAGNEAEALRLVRDQNPGVVLLDLDLGGQNGLDVARKLQLAGCQIPVVILSMHQCESFFNEAINLGVSGFVLKENAVTEVILALNAAVQGRTWFSAGLSDFWNNRFRGRSELARQNPGLDDLTGTERKIVGAIAERRTTREIAEAMGLSPLTVETHRRNICRKLGLTGSHPLLDFALRHRNSL